MSYLNRSLHWNSLGISYECDAKHVKTIVEELGLKNTAGVNTPGIKDDTNNEEEEPLPKERQHKARRLIALLNYMSADRPDISFAVKELAREMSGPTSRTEKGLIRIGKYLKSHPRCRLSFQWQRLPNRVTAHTDSDWAGCRKTRRSTSGGSLLIGAHLLKHWSKTQAGVALSSGEAELYALVKASTEIINVQGIF